MNEIVTWRVIQWSRELGRGRIGSPKSDPLDFDASVATVDDFEIGEEVRIELARKGDAWSVAQIQPAIGRFTPPVDAGSIVPDLRPEIADEVRDVLKQVRLQERYEVSNWTQTAIALRGEEVYMYPPPSDILMFDSPVYVELPMRLSPQILRLADAKERGYLAARVEDFSSEHVAIVFIDTDSRYFFVVCNGVRYLATEEGES
jgi:hypothetical protein